MNRNNEKTKENQEEKKETKADPGDEDSDEEVTTVFHIIITFKYLCCIYESC